MAFVVPSEPTSNIWSPHRKVLPNWDGLTATVLAPAVKPEQAVSITLSGRNDLLAASPGAPDAPRQKLSTTTIPEFNEIPLPLRSVWLMKSDFNVVWEKEQEELVIY